MRARDRPLQSAVAPDTHALRWGMPAPVWTLALLLLVSGLALLFSALLPTTSPSTVVTLRVCALIAGAFCALLLALRTAAPVWLCHAMLACAIALSTLLVAVSATAVGAVNSAMVLPVICLYAAYWWRRVVAAAYVGCCSGALAGGLIVAGHPNTVMSWVLITVICTVFVVVVGELVGQVRQQATTDHLTGYLNRVAMEALTSRPADRDRLVMVIDLDDFKELNDRLGHAAGDVLLRDVSRAWSSVLAPEDLALRTGGDEFVLVIGTDPDRTVESVVRRLREAHPAAWSIGCGRWPAGTSFDDALAVADRALYSQKHRRGLVETAPEDPPGLG